MPKKLRVNPDLDAAFLDAAGPVNGPPKGHDRRPRRKVPSTLDRDKARRFAFRVLALLSELSAADRQRVLKCALRANKI